MQSRINGWGVDSIVDSTGTETINFSGVTGENITINLNSTTGNEASYGTNTINWSNNAIEHAITSSGNDTITASSGNNSLNGGTGNDTYVFLTHGGAGTGNDTILDSAGTDTLDFSNITGNLSVNISASSGTVSLGSFGTVRVQWRNRKRHDWFRQ